MTSPQPITKEVVVKILLRDVPADESPGVTALAVYKATIEALHDRYTVMGYSYE